MVRNEEVTVKVQEALSALAPSLEEAVEGSGLKYSTVKAWSAGNRTPRPGSLEKLAGALDAHAEKLRALSVELRVEAKRNR